jgi:hypothetical protein
MKKYFSVVGALLIFAATCRVIYSAHQAVEANHFWSHSVASNQAGKLETELHLVQGLFQDDKIVRYGPHMLESLRWLGPSNPEWLLIKRRYSETWEVIDQKTGDVCMRGIISATPTSDGTAYIIHRDGRVLLIRNQWVCVVGFSQDFKPDSIISNQKNKKQ